MRKRKNSELVVKSNTLIEASYRLTSGEQRIILTLVSVIKPEDEEFKKYRFKVKDFCRMLEIKNNRLYKDIKDITKDLMRKVFTIKKEKSTLQISWLSSVEYIEGEGIVELEFSPKLKPYLLQLKNRFTSYELKDILQLKSSYSFRIYELLKQYEKIGSRTFNVEELKDILGIDENTYPLYADFKRRVIIQSQKEINKKTDIHFEIEQIKTGRKVTELKFIIKTNPNILKDDAKYIEEIKNIFDEDITTVNAEKIYRAANKNMDIIKEKYLLLQQQKDIKNVVGWIMKAIKEDYRPNELKGKVDSFNDYEQREYDYDELEKKLLGLG
ncbi:replication initiation protein [Clostridium sp. ZS2-4]|uniref:replication initiation protein n=1 Tax=Clostridium sp. ZS2-4 TaxID=2987703 RepID=UPI00227B21DA|nr:replication initiation protein [Clostridium sp. ZS2-4]MCY6356197.1 replication initiation protein [Clostridium sp. ZS2-4]